MNHEEIIIDYLKRINPSALEKNPDPKALKLRRILDSIEMVGFLGHLESVLGIKISDSDVLARNFETVGAVIEFARRKTSPN